MCFITYSNIIRTWNICIHCRCNIIPQLSEHYRNVLCSANDIAKFRGLACYYKHCTIVYVNVSQHCFPWRTQQSTQCDGIEAIAYRPISCECSFVQSSHGYKRLCPPDMRAFSFHENEVHIVLFPIFVCTRVTSTSTMELGCSGKNPFQGAFRTGDHLVDLWQLF